MQNNSVIIYRSKWEQQQDEFWTEHPGLALGLTGGAVVVFFIAFFFRHRRRF